MPSAFEIEKLEKWQDEGMELDAIFYAIEKAALANQRRVSYIDGTLKGWARQGITTLAQAQAADQEFEQRKKNGGRAGPKNKDTPRRFGKEIYA